LLSFDVLLCQVSYEDFKIHMARMYQQYERQQVVHISDPALRQQHPVSTISGFSETDSRQSQGKGVIITEVRDTSDQGTQVETEGEQKSDVKEEDACDLQTDDEEKKDESKKEKEDLEEENEDSDDKEKISQALGFESSVVEFINEVVEEVVSRVEGKVHADEDIPEEVKEEDVVKEAEVEKSDECTNDIGQEGDGANCIDPDDQVSSQGHHSPAEPQSAAEAQAAEKEAQLTGMHVCTCTSTHAHMHTHTHT